MKSKDQILLEKAFNNILLKENEQKANTYYLAFADDAFQNFTNRIQTLFQNVDDPNDQTTYIEKYINELSSNLISGNERRKSKIMGEFSGGRESDF